MAQVRFRVSSTQFRLLPHTDHAYESFQESTSFAAADVDCSVSVAYGDIAAPAGAREIFVSGRLWSLLEDRRSQRLIRRIPVPDSTAYAAWIAEPSRDLRRVTVMVQASATIPAQAQEGRAHPLRYPLDQILLSQILSLHEGVILHATGLHVGGRAFVLPGRSGRGKTTIARILAAQENVTVLSDDRIALRAHGDDIRAYGTPWPSAGGFAVNAGFPAAALLFLAHGPVNRLRPLSHAETVKRLIPVASIPWYEQRLSDGALAFCDRLGRNLPAFELAFAPTPAVAEFLAAACAELGR